MCVFGVSRVRQVVRGIQSHGVIANAKHYVHNNQESDRQGGVMVVDERTHWEIYMPPFAAAVRAGVGSVMCSYNRIALAGETAWASSSSSSKTSSMCPRLVSRGRFGTQGERNEKRGKSVLFRLV